MKFIRYILCLILFLNITVLLLSQDNKILKKYDFTADIDSLQVLMYSDLDKGFVKLKPLLEEAITQKDSLAELRLLKIQCWYYLVKLDLDNVILSARHLGQKATIFKNIHAQADSHVYLSQAYLINDLHSQALDEYKKSIEILKEADSDDPKTIQARARAHTYISNLYLQQEKPKEAVNKLLMALKEYENIKDPQMKKNSQYLIFCNIGTVYAKFDLDSAEYYILKSIGIKPIERKEEDFTMFLNYSVLGDIYLKRKKYDKALQYYQQAEKVYPQGSGDLLNLEVLYKGLIETYDALGNPEASKQYKDKLNETRAAIYQNKYKSMHSVLKEFSSEENKEAVKWYYILPLFAIIVILSLYYIYKYKKIKTKTEKPVGEEFEPYDTLLNLVKNNNPAFIFAFEKIFPDFNMKLQEINPELTKTDIEFCALMKIKLSIKEIAKFKQVHPRTAQNRKYQIRNKLGIPNSTDIYDWLEKI